MEQEQMILLELQKQNATDVLNELLETNPEFKSVLIPDFFIPELDRIMTECYKKDTNLSKNLVVILKNKIKFFLSGNSMIHKSELTEPLENTLRSKLENACHTIRNSHFIKPHIESFQSKQHKKYDDHFANFINESITSINLVVDDYESYSTDPN